MRTAGMLSAVLSGSVKVSHEIVNAPKFVSSSSFFLNFSDRWRMLFYKAVRGPALLADHFELNAII